MFPIKTARGVGRPPLGISRRPFFALLCFILFLFCLCEPGRAGNSNSTRVQGAVELFAAMRTKLPSGLGCTELVADARFFTRPFLLAGDGVMAVFSQALNTRRVGGRIGVVAKYIEAGGAGWAERVAERNGRNWKTQLAMVRGEGNDHVYEEANQFAVIKDSRVHLFFVTFKKRNTIHWTGRVPHWKFELVVGDIYTGPQGSKRIFWDSPNLSLSKLNREFNKRSLRLLPHDPFCMLTEDGKIVFAVKAMNGNQTVFAIAHSKGTWNKGEWNVSLVDAHVNCSFFFFGWDKKIIMAPLHCRNEKLEMRESVDMGKTWTTSAGVIPRVWKSTDARVLVATPTIGNKTVLLFTQRKLGRKDDVLLQKLRLVVTDGMRVYDAGPIADTHYVAPSGLLYTNDELFLLRYEGSGTSKKTLLVRNKNKGKAIMSAVKSWADMDAYLSRPCSETAPKGAPPGTPCLTPMPIDGLVGFLSNTTNGDVWKDEYLSVNAIVRGGSKVDSGFTFNGTAAGAKWFVGQMEGEQYNFTSHGLSVVATVTIHDVPEDDCPLLTFGKILTTESMGLWFRKDKRWEVKFRNGKAATLSCYWETNRTYKVTLVLRDRSVSVYVDEGPLGCEFQLPSHEKKFFDVERIYIGGYAGGPASRLTVTNVFLYNRPFNSTEIDTRKRTLGEGRRLEDTAAF